MSFSRNVIGMKTPTSPKKPNTESASNVDKSPTFVTLITIKVNKSKFTGNLGPFLNKEKLYKLPMQFGPGPVNRVVRESVQNLVDSSMDQKEVI